MLKVLISKSFFVINKNIPLLHSDNNLKITDTNDTKYHDFDM